jgi:hypothetical protein
MVLEQLKFILKINLLFSYFFSMPFGNKSNGHSHHKYDEAYSIEKIFRIKDERPAESRWQHNKVHHAPYAAAVHNSCNQSIGKYLSPEWVNQLVKCRKA